MSYVPLASKLIGETITLEYDFQSQMVFGETLDPPLIASVTVTVASGVDPEPSNILTGAVTVSGTRVITKVTAGLGGVVYILTFHAAGSVTGTIYRGVRKLAILTDAGSYVASSVPSLTGDLPDSVVGRAYTGTLDITGGYAPYAPVGLISDSPPWMGYTVVGNELICDGTSDIDTLPSYTFSPEIIDAAGTHATSLQTILFTRTTAAGDLSDMFVGDSPTFSYTASLGTAPYTFSLVSGTLPTGLTLNSDGSVTGTATTSGVFSWTIRATDVNGIPDDLDDTAQVRVLAWLVAAQADDEIYFGSDADTWNDVLVTGVAGNVYVTVTPTNRIFSYEGAAQPRRSDDDGATWQNVSLPGTTVIYVSASGRMFRGHSSNGNVYYSDNDGDTWTPVASGVNAHSVCGYQTGGIEIVLVASSTNFAVSLDGGLTYGAVTAFGFSCVAAECSPSGFFVFSRSSVGMMWSTNNGTTINVGSGSFAECHTITYLGGPWIAIQRTNTPNTNINILRSTDGKAWSFVTTPSVYFESSEGERAAYRNGIAIAACKSPVGSLQIIKSVAPDIGTTWTTVSTSYGAADYGVGVTWMEMDSL